MNSTTEQFHLQSVYGTSKQAKEKDETANNKNKSPEVQKPGAFFEKAKKSCEW
ncbi:hypothetical protein [Endozoicomonas numazuensis]|uniref:hypothetical protein n=1 Tax=Endozoicomonas numazuensis TaxID=1137799 RepID=UPI000AB5CD0D|nr:hypothetical protein [Endozoicomonas numazuensis]